jgi:carbon-monoxide dehydrogenase medium subunit
VAGAAREGVGALIPAACDYYAPNTVEEAVGLLRQLGPDAQVLAGGHSLIPAMKLRLAEPRALVDIGRIPGLRGVAEEADAFVVGAVTTHAEVARHPALRHAWAAIADAADVIADVQVRNRGTLGGSLCHADPAADWAAVCLALEAELMLQGPGGLRTVPVREWFRGPFGTARETGEILTAVRLPRPGARTGSAYRKLARKASDFALAGACAVVSLGDDGRVAGVRIGVTGVAPAPYRAAAAEDVLAGRVPDHAAVAEAAERAADDAGDILTDVHGSEAYRRAMAVVYVRRALQAAVARASEPAAGHEAAV